MAKRSASCNWMQRRMGVLAKWPMSLLPCQVMVRLVVSPKVSSQSVWVKLAMGVPLGFWISKVSLPMADVAKLAVRLLPSNVKGLVMSSPPFALAWMDVNPSRRMV